MPLQQNIPLFYWSEKKLFKKDRENYGDLISRYLVEKISGREVQWVHPKKQPWYRINKTNFLAVGSILHHATNHSIVWGSGIIDRSQKIVRADFRAVRGPQTREFLLEQDLKCPEVYGDPALLLPNLFNADVNKRYRYGIIPHYIDFKEVSAQYKDKGEILVIDLMTLNIEDVTMQILQCEQTISSSLHGLIVSHAYKIPSVWVEFSNRIFGDGIKYRDYLESVEMEFYKAPVLEKAYSLKQIEDLFKNFPTNPEFHKIEELQGGLMRSCPFKK